VVAPDVAYPVVLGLTSLHEPRWPSH
jgi:hypothetical protein